MYFTMGLREKVALALAAITLIKLIYADSSAESNTLESDHSERQKRDIEIEIYPAYIRNVWPYIQSPKTRNIQSDSNSETIRKTFNFPDVEYPTASTPRPHFYLQETNILQRNPDHQPENPPSTAAQDPLRGSSKNIYYNNKKYSNPSNLKTAKNYGMKKTLPETDTISKSHCYKEEGAFPEVEYPISAKDTRKRNYWEQSASSGSDKIINNGLNSISQIDGNVKSSGSISSKVSVTSSANQKCLPPKESNILNTTPAPPQVNSTKSTTPFVLTPYTTLYYDTTPSYIDTRTDETKNTTPASKKTKTKKKVKESKKKKYTKKETLTALEKSAANDNCYEESPLYQNIPSTPPLSEEYITKTQASLVTVPELTSNKIDTCSSISNKTFSSKNIVSSNHLSEDDVTFTSPFKIRNDDKVPTVNSDNKVTSLSNAINTAEPKNSDNIVSYFEDNVRNSNKSLKCDDNNINISPSTSRADANILSSDDEEFTTDVFPDFDENILSMISVSTSTLSPMTFVAVDDIWINSDVIDPYKSLSYSNELDECYIAVP